MIKIIIGICIGIIHLSMVGVQADEKVCSYLLGQGEGTRYETGVGKSGVEKETKKNMIVIKLSGTNPNGGGIDISVNSCTILKDGNECHYVLPNKPHYKYRLTCTANYADEQSCKFKVDNYWELDDFVISNKDSFKFPDDSSRHRYFTYSENSEVNVEISFMLEFQKIACLKLVIRNCKYSD